jgi:hypothetical protein
MFNKIDFTITLSRPTLVLSGSRAIVFQTSLIGAAVILPVLAHWFDAPVRYLLPMHWPVILAGLVYGWRGGALTGLLAPSVSYLISGFPLPAILPSMTVELLTYGFLTGLLRERTTMSPFLSVAIALVWGRLAFVASVFTLGVAAAQYQEYLLAALTPGLAAACFQIALLPLLARWYVKQQRDSTGTPQ